MLNFEDLYETYAADVYRFAFWLAGDSTEAEDITSETFVRAWVRRTTIRTETLKAYLFTIARNVYLGHKRKSKRQIALEDVYADPAPEPDKLVESQVELRRVQRFLQTLPEIDRTAFILRVQHGLPYIEIARALGISLAAAKVKVHRVRKKLLIALVEYCRIVDSPGRSCRIIGAPYFCTCGTSTTPSSIQVNREQFDANISGSRSRNGCPDVGHDSGRPFVLAFDTSSLKPVYLHRMKAVRTHHIVIGLILLSFAVRIPFTHEYRLEGTGRDSSGYLKLAESFSNGEGWVSYSVQFLYSLPESLPHPDSYWSPLFPFLIAIVFSAFGVSFPVAQIVPMTFGVLLPSVVFLLAWELTRSRVAALIAGILAVFHPTLVLWSSRVQPEIVSVFFVTLTLYFLMRKETRLKPVWVGVSLGLAYLVKYQNGAVVIAIIVYYLFHEFRSRGWKQLLLTGVACVIAISPWLTRNTVVFGNPFFTAVQSPLISQYPEFGGTTRFVRSFDPPPEITGYIFSHLGDSFLIMRQSIHEFILPFLSDQTGSLWLIPLGVLGLCSVPITWKRGAPLICFSVFLVLFFSVTMPMIRYVFVLIPVWIAIVAVGTLWFIDPPARMRLLSGKPARIVLAAVLVLAVAGEVRGTLQTVYDRDLKWAPDANYGMLEAGAVSEFIHEHTDETEPVLVAQSYHYALALDRYSISIPVEEEGVRYLGQRYGARYVVMSLRDLRQLLPTWETEIPDWIELVHRIPAEEIPRPTHHPDYAHVSEMRIYRLK